MEQREPQDEVCASERQAIPVHHMNSETTEEGIQGLQPGIWLSDGVIYQTLSQLCAVRGYGMGAHEPEEWAPGERKVWVGDTFS